MCHEQDESARLRAEIAEYLADRARDRERQVRRAIKRKKERGRIRQQHEDKQVHRKDIRMVISGPLFCWSLQRAA